MQLFPILHDWLNNPAELKTNVTMRFAAFVFFLIFFLSANEIIAQNTVEVFVWDDLNANGIQDAGEPGISGATVQLWEDTNASGTVDADSGNIPGEVAGTYTFSAVPDGDYAVVFYTPTLPDQHYVTLLNQGAATMDSDADIAGAGLPGGAQAISNLFTLTGGVTISDVDGGFFMAADINGFTWEDMNGDGIQDGMDMNLGNVTVNITDCLGNPVNDVNGNPVGATTSDGAGNYSFLDLVPGDYIVIFTAPTTPEQFYFTETDYNGMDSEGNDGADDSDAEQMAGATQGQTHCMTLESNDDEMDIDAGMYRPVSVGDWVWHDANADGIQDPTETTGIQITIMIEDDMGNAVTDVNGTTVPSQSSTATGAYLFDNLPPGDYVITFVTVFPWMLSPDNALGGTTDATDVMNDSDAVSPTGMTHVISLSSDEEETDIDVGVWQFISVGGTIWVDDNENCEQDGSEPIAPGALSFTLHADDNDDGISDGIVATLVSAGEYCFTDVPPGLYFIELDASNFETGGPLQLFSGTNCPAFPTPPDPDDDQDGDDNGFPTADGGEQTFTFELLCGEEPTNEGVENKTIDIGLIPQCDVPAFQPAPICDDLALPQYEAAFPICDLAILDSYCARMNENSSANAGSPLCGGAGVFNNTSWFSFVAGSNMIELVVTPTNCSPGSGGQLGVQAGIYTDCSLTESVFCQGACSEDPISVSSSNFVPGQTYYFFLDGCAGSVCDYEVELVSGGVPFQLPEPTDLVCDLPDCAIDPVITCPSSDPVTFTVEGIDIVATYNWTASPSIPGFLDQTTENFNEVVLDTDGTYTICMTLVDNGCDITSNQVCKTVTIQTPPDEDFMDYYVCEGTFPDAGPQSEDPNMDGNAGWEGPAFTAPGNYSAMVTVDGCNFMQNIEVFQYDLTPTIQIDTAFCSTDGGIDICGSFYDQTLLNLNCSLQDQNGCDSTVVYNIVEINAAGQIATGTCINGMVPISTDMFTQWTTYDDVQFCYYKDFIGGELIQCVDDPLTPVNISIDGDYFVEVIITHNSVQCSFEIGPFEFSIADYLPPYPVAMNWPTTVCAGETGLVFEVQDLGGGVVTWTVPIGASIVSGIGTNSIVVDWNTAMDGDICVYAQNACGTGSELCEPISFTPSPVALFTQDDEICVSGSATFEYDGVDVPGQTYEWDFGSGAVISGTANTAGPFEVEWNSDGTQPVGLIVTLNGCSSEEYTSTIDILPPLLPPSISCGLATATEVSFNIGTVAGATGYIVNVTTGQAPGTLMGGVYTVGGLSPGDEVTIEVISEGPAPCGNSIAGSFSCTAQDCIPPTLSLSAPMDMDTICLDNASTMQLIATLDDPTVMGTGEFAGNGVTTDGIFDPNDPSVMIGPNVINYTFTTDLGCIGGGQMTIWVYDVPDNSFTVSDDLICITESVTLQYSGGVALDEYFWTIDDIPTDPSWGAGPFDINWTTTGPKNITLSTSRFGCVSPVATMMVTVEPELEAPNFLMCDQTTNSVEFFWDPVANATGYEVTYNGNTTTQTTTDFFIGSLNPDDMVSIEVIAISGNSCPNVMSMNTCTATDCVDRQISFNISDQTICLDANASTIDIDATIDGGGAGVITESYVGAATDPVTGVFDPFAAGEGEWTIVYNHQEDNCPYADSLTITVVSQPNATFLMNEMMCVTETVEVLYNGDQGTTSAFDYAWNFDGANVISGSGVGPYVLSWDNAGTYTVEVIASNGDCDSEPFSLPITVEPLLTEPLFDACVTTLNSVEFSWTADPCATEYNLSITTNSGTEIINQTATTYLATNLAENEVVTIVVEAVSGCLCGNVSSMTTCTAQACPTITLALSSPENDFCLADMDTPFNLDAIVTGGNNTGSGEWSGIGISTDGTFDPNDAGIGTHTLTYLYTEDNCPFSDNISITIYDSPSATFNIIDPECYDSPSGCIEIIGSGGSGTYSYFLDNASIPDENPCNLVPGDYEIRVEDDNGCSYTETLTVSAPFSPTFSLSSVPTVVELTENTVDLVFNVPGANVDSLVVYQDGLEVCSGSVAECGSYTYTAIDDDVFTATLYFDGGCSINATTTVLVEEIVEIEVTNVYIPTGFSPNGDGFNDIFGVDTDSSVPVINTFRIFDRWGEMVFEAENYAPTDPIGRWDGRFKGEYPVPGVYVYFVEYVTDLGEIVVLSGDVTLVQ